MELLLIARLRSFARSLLNIRHGPKAVYSGRQFSPLPPNQDCSGSEIERKETWKVENTVDGTSADGRGKEGRNRDRSDGRKVWEERGLRKLLRHARPS